MFGTVEEIASRGGGEISLERIEATDIFEFFAESFEGAFEYSQ